jgi:hypothetical protein
VHLALRNLSCAGRHHFSEVQSWLGRTGQLPIHVSLHESWKDLNKVVQSNFGMYDEMLQKILELVGSHSHHLYSLDITIIHQELAEEALAGILADSPILHSLTLLVNAAEPLEEASIPHFKAHSLR